MIQIPQAYLERLLYDPALFAWVMWGIKLDAFQSVRAKEMWLTANYEDSSGFGTGKTLVDWIVVNMSAALIPDCRIGVFYQNFQAGKDQFWIHYNQFSSPLWKTQLGRIDMEGEESGKPALKEPSNWKVYFKNGSIVMMPAPNWLQEGEGLAGLDLNRGLFDEWTKSVSSEGGMTGLTKQLFGRIRRACYNKHHPVWCNKIWKTATAELTDHPSYRLHKATLTEIKRGNADYGYVTFSFRDWSDQPSHVRGKSFKDVFRDDKIIHTLRTSNTREKALAEVFGLYSKQARGWYTQEMVDACQALGAQRNLIPVLSRAEDPLAAQALYFYGVDSAPAQGQRSDAGALVVLRALPAVADPGQMETDWRLDFVHARMLRAVDATGWSGHIHQAHQAFAFEVIVLDHGGGGQWIAPELRKPRQTIDGIETACLPIVPRHSNAIEGQYVLVMFSRGDDSIRELWPDLKNARGDDVLKDWANTLFQTALAKGQIGIPTSHNERPPASYATWEEERIWASRLLTDSGLTYQLVKIKVLTDEQGNWRLTSHHAKQYVSSAKDDLHDAARNAYVGFRIWLLANDAAFRSEDAALCDAQ